MSVFLKGHPIPGVDPSGACRDDFGLELRFADHGDRTSPYGWEVDHVRPRALGGTDEFANLRPLHWRVNAALGGTLGNL